MSTVHKLHDIITHQTAIDPKAPALIWEDQTYSFGQLNQSIQNAKAAIFRDTNPGDRIAVLALNNPDYVVLMYAVPAADRILVVINARLAAEEIALQLKQVDAQLLIGDSKLIERQNENVVNTGPLETIPTVSFGKDYQSWLQPRSSASQAFTSSPKENQFSSDIAWLMFTSGTTGLPKPAILTHSSLMAGLSSANAGRPVQKNDRYLYPFPLFHVSAHNVLLQHQHGAAVVLLSSFDAATVLERCQQHKVTTLSLAPTMISMLLNHPSFSPDALEQVRTIGYGASAIVEPLLKQVIEQTRCGLSQGFGMTELSGSVAFLHPQDHRDAVLPGNKNLIHRLKSVGKPVNDVEVELFDESFNPVPCGEQGEIAVRAKQVFAGYWQMEEASEQSFHKDWLLTGDIGRFDEDGYLYIVDRKKDIIVSGGENISPREVESAFASHPNIKQMVVFGLQDQQWGEAVHALIETMDGNNIPEQVLFDFSRAHLARYKTPKQFHFGSIPLNASGKVDKIAIKQQFSNC